MVFLIECNGRDDPMKRLFRTKSIQHIQGHSDLSRSLNAFDLTLFGIGAIIGAGVFVLTGVAAATKAGPAISVSYIIAGLAALFSALSYAELATSVGGSGSAYHYTYASFGEFIAWLIGWALILEYLMSVSTVAVGWSGYLINIFQALHVHLPSTIFHIATYSLTFNLPAMLIIVILILLLSTGVKFSAYFNMVIVIIKLITIGIFIAIAAQNVNPPNWEPFFPFGLSGVVSGASIVFFAYIGFDAISTAAEETINPQRNLPIGIMLSLFICTVIYVVVGLLLTGIISYKELNIASPVSYALLHIGYPIGAGCVAVGAIAGLTTVMLVFFYGLTRILFAISRDGLLPKWFSKINPKSKTPTRCIVLMGIIIALIAGLCPLEQIAELVNIGTLTAFTFVCLGVIITRFRHPNLPRPFKLPYYPIIPLLGVIFCVYLIAHLATATLERFAIWMLIGIIVYFLYSKKHSLLE